jgi:hypothetical protein
MGMVEEATPKRRRTMKIFRERTTGTNSTHHYIKAAIFPLLGMLIASLAFLGTAAHAATYTIQSNSDFATYFGNSPSVALQPGDTVQIADGTYNPPQENSPYQTLVCSNINGSAGHWITITAAPGAHPVIVLGDSTIGFAAGWLLRNCSFIRVSGLELEPTNPNSSSANIADGIDANNWNGGVCHDIQFVNNIVHDFGGNGIGGTASQFLIENNIVYNCCYWNTTGGSGIHPCAPRMDSSDNSHFASDNGEFGNPNNQYAEIIRNNTVYGCEMKVLENGGTAVDGVGIEIDDFFTNNFGDSSHRTLVCNNVVYGGGPSGIRIFQSSYIDAYFNTCYHNCSTYSSGELEVQGDMSNTTNINVYDNILVATGTGNDTWGLALSGQVGASWGYNMNYGAPNYFSGTGDIDGQDPKFASPGTGGNADFHLLAGSPAIGGGNSGGGITGDRDGNSRQTSDIGAYAYHFLLNPSFEDDGYGTGTPLDWAVWSSSGQNSSSYVETYAGAENGFYHLTHYSTSGYNVQTYQTLNVPNGVYTLSFWAKSSVPADGTQSVVGFIWDEANGYVQTVINGVANTNGWTYFTTPSIAINGNVEIGFTSSSVAGNNWTYFDNVALSDPPPSAPTGLKATAGAKGTKQIVVSWTSTAGANSYKVYQSTSSGGTYSLIASPTTTSYTKTGLTAGTTYYYKVSAVDGGGAGPLAGPVSAKAQ